MNKLETMEDHLNSSKAQRLVPRFADWFEAQEVENGVGICELALDHFLKYLAERAERKHYLCNAEKSMDEGEMLELLREEWFYHYYRIHFVPRTETEEESVERLKFIHKLRADFDSETATMRTSSGFQANRKFLMTWYANKHNIEELKTV